MASPVVHIRGLHEDWSDDVRPNDRDRLVIEQACRGCQQDRYNRGRGYVEDPKRDCPVYCFICMHVPNVRYDRHTRRYRCGSNDARRAG